MSTYEIYIMCKATYSTVSAANKTHISEYSTKMAILDGLDMIISDKSIYVVILYITFVLDVLYILYFNMGSLSLVVIFSVHQDQGSRVMLNVFNQRQRP